MHLVTALLNPSKFVTTSANLLRKNFSNLLCCVLLFKVELLHDLTADKIFNQFLETEKKTEKNGF